MLFMFRKHTDINVWRCHMSCSRCGAVKQVKGSFWKTGRYALCHQCYMYRNPTQHQMNRKMDKQAMRLGLHYDIRGIDPENIPNFARIIRLAGVLITALIIWWGNWYEWSYKDSPFESLADSLGIHEEEFAALMMSVGIAALGYYQRFRIGLFIGIGTTRKIGHLIKKIISRI